MCIEVLSSAITLESLRSSLQYFLFFFFFFFNSIHVQECSLSEWCLRESWVFLCLLTTNGGQRNKVNNNKKKFSGKKPGKKKKKTTRQHGSPTDGQKQCWDRGRWWWEGISPSSVRGNHCVHLCVSPPTCPATLRSTASHLSRALIASFSLTSKAHKPCGPL